MVACAALSLTLMVSGETLAQEPVVVELDTTEGKIILELNRAKAPKTVENFLKYVEKGHYTGTIFHRVMKDFMIQGGGLDAELKEKATLAPVVNEGGNGLTNDHYTVAMARKADPNSATSQFFINTSGKNTFLNRNDPNSDGFGYTVFGKVVEGQEVVDKIAARPTKSMPNPAFRQMLMENVPVEPVTIQGVRVLSGNNQ